MHDIQLPILIQFWEEHSLLLELLRHENIKMKSMGFGVKRVWVWIPALSLISRVFSKFPKLPQPQCPYMLNRKKHNFLLAGLYRLSGMKFIKCLSQGWQRELKGGELERKSERTAVLATNETHSLTTHWFLNTYCSSGTGTGRKGRCRKLQGFKPG